MHIRHYMIGHGTLEYGCVIRISDRWMPSRRMGSWEARSTAISHECASACGDWASGASRSGDASGSAVSVVWVAADGPSSAVSGGVTATVTGGDSVLMAVPANGP